MITEYRLPIIKRNIRCSFPELNNQDQNNLIHKFYMFLFDLIMEIIKSKNFSINNIYINIIAQRPKIKKYSKKMIKSISNLCTINPNQISIKGKTTEKLGLIGKEKAIASEVVVSVVRYD